MSEKTVAFRIDEELHKRIKMRLIETDKTLKDYVIDLILKDLDNSLISSQSSKKEESSIDIQSIISEFVEYLSKKQSEQSSKRAEKE